MITDTPYHGHTIAVKNCGDFSPPMFFLVRWFMSYDWSHLYTGTAPVHGYSTCTGYSKPRTSILYNDHHIKKSKMSNAIQTILKEVVDKVVHDNTRKRKHGDLPKLRIKKPNLSWDIKREPIGNGCHLVMSGPNHCGSPVCEIEDPPALCRLSKSLTSPRGRSQMQSPFTPVTLTPHSPPPLSLTPPALPHTLTGIVPKAEFDEWH